MHELSLAERAIQIVEHAARKAGLAQVTRVTLAIGELAHVEPETLVYCCALAAKETCAAGAEFRIERRSGHARCRHCTAIVEVSRLGAACPQCGSHALDITAGDELQVLEIATRTAQEKPTCV